MRIALISVENNIINMSKPYSNAITELREFKSRKRLWDCPNLSLLTVAAYLPQEWLVDYYDLNKEINWELPDIYDMVFFTATTAQVNRVYELADVYRDRGKIVVLGGIHVSNCCEEAMNHSDVVIVGEFEGIYVEFIEDICRNQVKKIYRAEKSPNYFDLFLPVYELAKKYNYSVIPIQFTRGCPHNCEFCASTAIYGTSIRKKKIERIEKELQLIITIWKSPHIFVTDDNLYIDRMYAECVVELLKKYNVRWYGFSDVRIARDRKLLRKLRQAGCAQLLIGFESVSKESLSTLNSSKWKMRQREYYESAVEIIQSYGIGVVGSFVLGLDGDTEETFEKIKSFIFDTNIFATNITICTPFPGTRLYARLKGDGRLLTEDWSCYNGFELTYQPLKIDYDRFERKYLELNLQINSNERIDKLLSQFRNIYKQKESETLYGNCN